MNSAPVRKMRNQRRTRGFTLIEAMAAVVLLGIGIVGAMGSFATVIRTEDQVRQTEYMQRLAQDKLADLVATGQAATSTNGDFSDQNITDYTWRLEVNTSGITDLNSVTLYVERSNGGNGKVRLDTVLYVPPETTTSGGTN